MKNGNCDRRFGCLDFAQDNCDGCGANKPQGDLISRSELKHHKFLSPDNPNATRFYDETTKAYQKGWNDAIDAVIDNAPTVEYTFEEAFQKTVCEQRLYCPERPQGEWIDHSEDYGYAECPFCEHLTTCGDNIDELHYCWNCGARLGKAKTGDIKTEDNQ